MKKKLFLVLIALCSATFAGTEVVDDSNKAERALLNKESFNLFPSVHFFDIFGVNTKVPDGITFVSFLPRYYREAPSRISSVGVFEILGRPDIFRKDLPEVKENVKDLVRQKLSERIEREKAWRDDAVGKISSTLEYLSGRPDDDLLTWNDKVEVTGTGPLFSGETVRDAVGSLTARLQKLGRELGELESKSASIEEIETEIDKKTSKEDLLAYLVNLTFLSAFGEPTHMRGNLLSLRELETDPELDHNRFLDALLKYPCARFFYAVEAGEKWLKLKDAENPKELKIDREQGRIEEVPMLQPDEVLIDGEDVDLTLQTKKQLEFIEEAVISGNFGEAKKFVNNFVESVKSQPDVFPYAQTLRDSIYAIEPGHPNYDIRIGSAKQRLVEVKQILEKLS